MKVFKSFTPWVVGALAAGFAWALHIPTLLALGVGVVVTGVYLTVSVILARGGTQEPVRLSPEIAALRARALESVSEINEMTLSVPGIDASEVRTQAQQVLVEFDRTSATISTLDQSLARFDIAALNEDSRRVRMGLHNARGDSRKTLMESDRMIQSQVEVFERLRNMRSSHMNTLHSSVIGLDGIVARVAELEALSVSTGQVDLTRRRLDEVGSNLESLRQGFADSDRAARELLEGF